MANKEDIRRTAEDRFTATQRRDAEVKAQLEKERTAFDARTAKLRALRLAKEEEDRQAKARFDAENPPAPRKTVRRKVAQT